MSESAICQTCSKQWPQVTFKKFAELAAGRDANGIDPLCDSCWDRPITAEGQIAEKIDEAQGSKPKLRRIVHIEGIESGTSLISICYCTHEGMFPLVVTEVLATFKGGAQYIYRNVPVAVCEAWYAAPSKGGYFIQFIKTSYECERVK